MNYRMMAAVLHEVRKLDDQLTILGLILLFTIGSKGDGCAMQDLIQETKIDKATVSRLLNIFGRQGRNGKRGAGLIWLHESPADRRHKIVRLTADGVEVFNNISKILEGAQ